MLKRLSNVKLLMEEHEIFDKNAIIDKINENIIIKCVL